MTKLGKYVSSLTGTEVQEQNDELIVWKQIEDPKFHKEYTFNPNYYKQIIIKRFKLDIVSTESIKKFKIHELIHTIDPRTPTVKNYRKLQQFHDDDPKKGLGPSSILFLFRFLIHVRNLHQKFKKKDYKELFDEEEILDVIFFLDKTGYRRYWVQTLPRLNIAWGKEDTPTDFVHIGTSREEIYQMYREINGDVDIDKSESSWYPNYDHTFPKEITIRCIGCGNSTVLKVNTMTRHVMICKKCHAPRLLIRTAMLTNLTILELQALIPRVLSGEIKKFTQEDVSYCTPLKIVSNSCQSCYYFNDRNCTLVQSPIEKHLICVLYKKKE